jgi:hypothetical protein
MTAVVDWQEWLKRYQTDIAYPFMFRAVATLIANSKALAVWISGSRAIGRADQFSDLDIRIHAPTWTANDLAPWLYSVDPSGRPLVRLSKLGPTNWSYECVFADKAPIDLLVTTDNRPTISFDSVIFKVREPFFRQTSLQVGKESVANSDQLRNLIDGLIIDQQKFGKLMARGERLAALFLLEAQRLAVLRLAYIATRGVDCGDRSQHTLASLKLIRGILLNEAPSGVTEAVQNLSAEGSITESAEKIFAAAAVVSAAVKQRFPRFPSGWMDCP